MNRTINHLGQCVIAVGAPGSIERRRAEMEPTDEPKVAADKMRKYKWLKIIKRGKLHLVSWRDTKYHDKSLCGAKVQFIETVDNPEDEDCCAKCAHERNMIRSVQWE